MNRKILLIAILACTVGILQAQQDPHYSLYVFNQWPFNPATTADKGVTSLNAQYRHQWLQVDGAPKTGHFNAQIPFMNGRNGFGIGLTGDRIGMTATNSLHLSYAYRFALKGAMKLGIGLAGSIDQNRIEWDKSRPLDQTDQAIPNNPVSQFGPNFGLGVQLSGEKFYVGAGIPKLLPTKLYSEDYLSLNGEGPVQTLAITAGTAFAANQNLKIVPSALVLYNKHHPLSANVSAQLIFMDKFGLGANYRVGDSVDALLMYKLTRQLKVGFAWDVTTSKLQQITNGGFEIMLGYQPSKKAEACERMDDLRFF